MTTHLSSYNRQTGFTLVELLIVAIILAILAAIVVPQFANVAQGSNESALRTNLSGIRSAVELYRQQHNGNYPGATTAVPAASCTVGAGTGTAGTGAAFTDQLAKYTNAAGQACSVQNDGTLTYAFGPYIKENNVPLNPVTTDGTIVVNNEANLAMASATAGGGWLFSTATGKFIADDTNTDVNGVRYDSY